MKFQMSLSNQKR